MTFDYKKYSLENLENWMHDAMSAGEATPQEIYDVIVGVVKENYYIYKHQTSQAYELLALLNGNGQSYEDVVKEKEYYEPSMPPWGHSDLEYGLANSFLTQDRNSNFPNENTVCDKDDPSPECKGAWNDFWQEHYYPEEHKLHVTEDGDIYSVKDKVVKWQLPVQVDGLSGDCFVEFPDDLLEAANLKEGETVEWIDRGDGSFELRKVTKPLGMDEC
jgi:hypothetical protein